MRLLSRFLVVICLACIACDEAGDEVLEVNATGTVVGIAYLDRDGNSLPSPNVDAPVPNLQVGITTAGGVNPIATTTTDSVGIFRFADLPVGSYRVIALGNPPGDSISVVSIDSSRITVAASDTAEVLVTVGYSTSKLSALSSLPVGRRIAVTGAALNTWPTFGDSTIHLADSTGAVRLIGVRPANINIGDRIRVIATIAQRDGRVALSDPTLVSTQAGEEPAPSEVTTAQAAIAGGVLDANLVRIHDATVTDAASLAGGDVLLTVNDGSGTLEVLIDVNANIATALPVAPGAQLDVVGVLVPDVLSGKWRLKPRRTGDVTVRYLPVSIATARTRQPGQFVVIEGIALNNLSAFGDLTLHVNDATGSMRIFAARSAFISTGDSVSVLGAVTLVLGVPVLTNATPSVIVRRVAPDPVPVSTQAAASADNGRLDAALVRITGRVTDADTVGTEIRLTINDSSGAVTVVLDPDAALNIAIPAVNTSVDITGVLVPFAVRVWALKPRTTADIRIN